MIKTSLYIHLPWCLKCCPYCDFNAHQQTDASDFVGYTQALVVDLVRQANQYAVKRIINTIYLGGGTPSLFAPELIANILAAVRNNFQVADDVEVSMECNPGAREFGDLAGYYDAGINRLSLGVQSLQPNFLQALGRVHDHTQALRAITEAKSAGFTKINVDLMYALPGQDVGFALADLQLVLDLGISHISWYQLTIEPNTVFAKYPPRNLPSHDQIWAMEEQGGALLAAHGLERYEVSAYALSGHQCQHNLQVWEFGDYFGVGAGAHGKLTDAGKVIRTVKLKMPNSYQQDSVKTIVNVVSEDKDILFEYMLNRLRLYRTLTRIEFEAATNLSWEVVGNCLRRSNLGQDLVVIEDNSLQITSKGYNFLDDITTVFMK
jgi:putative oxygen-independent coproporphyrinogen III oxidase